MKHIDKLILNQKISRSTNVTSCMYYTLITGRMYESIRFESLKIIHVHI